MHRIFQERRAQILAQAVRFRWWISFLCYTSVAATRSCLTVRSTKSRRVGSKTTMSTKVCPTAASEISMSTRPPRPPGAGEGRWYGMQFPTYGAMDDPQVANRMFDNALPRNRRCPNETPAIDSGERPQTERSGSDRCCNQIFESEGATGSFSRNLQRGETSISYTVCCD